MNLKLSVTFTSTVAALALLAGCDVGDKTPELTRTPPKNYPEVKFAAEAGIGATVNADPANSAMQLAKNKSFGVRYDSFALLPSERTFDRSQTSARLVNEGGGFITAFELPDEAPAEPVVVETLPNWRLSGIIVSDGVAALLDKGNEVIDIRPGQKIAGTDWTVVSIDEERAVLRRNNGKLPKTFVVPLQSAGAGSATGGGDGGTGGGGGLGKGIGRGGGGGASTVGGD